MTRCRRAAAAPRATGTDLAWFTIDWNSVEGFVGIASGVVAGSIALVGFGVDCYIGVLSGALVLWQLSKEGHRGGLRGSRAPGAADHRPDLLALAGGVTVESARKLVTGEHPSASAPSSELRARSRSARSR